MKPMQHRSVCLALGLLTSIAFAACSGLDGRKVTRGPAEGAGDQAAGGDGSGNTGNTGNTGNEPGAGGSENLGGEANNPFGGETFTGGAPPEVDGPPEVLKVDPASDADDAEPGGRVSLLFSEGLDESTIDSASISVSEDGTDVEGDLSYSGVVATFTPASRLSLLATYDINATTAITDTGGQPLKAAFSSQFTVRDGVWAAQKQVFDDQTTWGHSQDAGIDGRGNMLTVYPRAPDPKATNIRSPFARWINVSAGPRDEDALESSKLNCSNVQVAVSPEGDAIAAWLIYDAKGAATLRARRFVSGAWEAAPQNVAQMSATNPVQSAEFSLAIGGGQVAVSWIRYYYDTQSHYAVEYTAAAVDGAWPTNPTSQFSVTYAAPNYESMTGIRSALDGKGNALVVFAYNNSVGDTKGIYYARKAVGGSWQYPAKIPSSTIPNDGPYLASDGDGAMVIWSDYVTATTKYRVLASRYTKAKQFVAPVAINDPDLGEYVYLRSSKPLSTNGASFFATWTQAVANSQNTYIHHYDIATSKWDALPTPVSDGVASSGGYSSIGVDAHGNAVVAFEQQGLNYTTMIMASRFVASTGTWSEAEPLTENGVNFGQPLVNVADNGVASVFFASTGRETPGGQTPYVGGQYRFFK